ncbi:MAG: hypothetical protein WA793_10590 [Sphingorhabdus sp.]|uniref:hypothetical protein n=1 Tax=Sphingorhabdus sp. TaxID=1902408 RepID=UPI003C866968
MKVEVDIMSTEVDGEYGLVEGLRVSCERCGHEVTVFGTGSASARRAAIMLRDECPNEENNFYDVDWYS